MTDVKSGWTIDAAGALEFVSGTAATAQRLRVRLSTNQGEWRFNRDHGMPWLYAVLGQSGDSAAIRGLLIRQVSLDAEVSGIGEIAVTKAGRQLSYTIPVRVRNGDDTTVSV